MPVRSDLERFCDCMEYRSSDRRPNHELGVWPQTAERWRVEAPEAVAGWTWNWFEGEDALGLDRREYIPIHYGFLPPFEYELGPTHKIDLRRLPGAPGRPESSTQAETRSSGWLGGCPEHCEGDAAHGANMHQRAAAQCAGSAREAIRAEHAVPSLCRSSGGESP